MYYQNYKDRLFDNKGLFNIKMHTKNNIKSEKDGCYTIKQNELCCPSMMIHIFGDGITFLPYGHCEIETALST